MSVDHPRRLGDRAEAEVLKLLPWLRYVSDQIAPHWDAVARQSLGPVQEGQPVEIKPAVAELASGKAGRFYLRRPQHLALLKADGFYLFVACAPTRDRDVLAWRFVRSRTLDADLIHGWWDGGPDRADYRQLPMSALFLESELDCPDHQRVGPDTGEDPPPKWVIDDLPFHVDDYADGGNTG